MEIIMLALFCTWRTTSRNAMEFKTNAQSTSEMWPFESSHWFRWVACLSHSPSSCTSSLFPGYRSIPTVNNSSNHFEHKVCQELQIFCSVWPLSSSSSSSPVAAASSASSVKKVENLPRLQKNVRKNWVFHVKKERWGKSEWTWRAGKSTVNQRLSLGL